MIEGGKASTTPAMAQTLGPLKMDMKAIISDINEKTMTYKGLKVPVELNVDEKDKTYTITVRSPPAAELIKNALKIKKGSGEPEKLKVGNIAVEQLITIAEMKKESLFTTDLKAAIKAVAGTCNSLGILVEGQESHDFTEQLNAGAYDGILSAGTTDVNPEKATVLKQQLADVQAVLDKRFAKKKQAKEAEEEKKAEAAPAEGEEKKEGEEAKSETDKKEGGDKK